MKTEDELLDEIIAYLKNEPVGDVPRAHIADRSSKSWSSSLYLVVGGVVAASVIGLLLSVRDVLLPSDSELVSPDANDRGSRVVVLSVDLTEPLSRLETGLDEIDVEIAALRREAELLDARRMADSLLVQYQSTRH